MLVLRLRLELMPLLVPMLAPMLQLDLGLQLVIMLRLTPGLILRQMPRPAYQLMAAVPVPVLMLLPKPKRLPLHQESAEDPALELLVRQQPGQQLPLHHHQQPIDLIKEAILDLIPI